MDIEKMERLDKEIRKQIVNKDKAEILILKTKKTSLAHICNLYPQYHFNWIYNLK